MNSDSQSYSLWKDANFLRLWGGTVLSSFGDGAYFILLGWFVIEVTKSDLALGTAFLCSSIPRLVFMLIGGVAADRMSRKTILLTSLVTRSLVLIIFSVLLWGAEKSVGIYPVYGMAVIFGIVDAFFWTASGSIVPVVVTEEAIGTANSVIQTSQQLSAVAGPIIAAGLLFIHGYPWMFLSVAGLYVVGSILLATLQLRKQPEPSRNVALGEQEACTDSQNEITRTSAWRDLSDGIRHVLSIRILAIIMVIALFINVLYIGPMNIGLPILVKHLHWSGSEYGYLQAAAGVGGIVGGVLTGLFRNLRGHFKWLSLIGCFMGFSFAVIGVLRMLPVDLVFMAIAGISMSLLNIPIITYVQTIVDNKMLGRVMSLLMFMSQGLGPVSYAVCSFILQVKIISVEYLIFICGAIMGLFTLSLVLIPAFRNMEDHPKWQAAVAPVMPQALHESVGLES